MTVLTVNDLTARVATAARAAGSGRRFLLGITGPPGAGKSRLAASLATALTATGHPAGVAGMDGFHLTGTVLRATGALDHKGRPDTFDVAAFVRRSEMLRDSASRVPWPVYDRELHDPVPDAMVFDEHRIAIVEGNYLLLDRPGWSEVRAHMDAVWYLDADDALIERRLLRRHRRGGKPPDRARAMVFGNDLPNARLIAQTRARAELVLVATTGGYLIRAAR